MARDERPGGVGASAPAGRRSPPRHAALTPVTRVWGVGTYGESRYAWRLGKRLSFDDYVHCARGQAHAMSDGASCCFFSFDSGLAQRLGAFGEIGSLFFLPLARGCCPASRLGRLRGGGQGVRGAGPSTPPTTPVLPLVRVAKGVPVVCRIPCPPLAAGGSRRASSRFAGDMRADCGAPA